MKALSIWQPWAQLIARGDKTIETRNWRAPAVQSGTRIAIHAGKKKINYENFVHADRNLLDLVLPMNFWFLAPRGVILATAILSGCEQVDADRSNAHNAIYHTSGNREIEAAFGDFRPGRWMWYLDAVDRLTEPIPMRGQQGLFEIGEIEQGLFKIGGME